MKTRLFFILTLLTLHLSFSQVIRCVTDEMEIELRNQNPQRETRDQFDEWLNQEIEQKASSRIIGGVYQIPVVVHVIHSGEAVGNGTNISLAAIQSQIDVLNEDFRKILGSNGYNTHPVGADTEIEFCLAKRRPDGSAFPNGEDGVNRINYTTINSSTAPPFTTSYINSTIKTYTYNNGNPTPTRGWHPGKYLNIWVCNISGGTLGYAQFPQSALGGMGCGSVVDATDGVVFTYNSIGKSSVTGFSGPYVEGRTATHEVGHWLGLRHIWGDGGCSVDDYCNDTPLAAAANFGCPVGTNSCTTAPDAGLDMIENYMDYTDDLCMNIFTFDQKTRMRTVLESSPLRLSLINSDACIPPNLNDVSVIDILSPKGDNCPGSVSPIVTIKNRGSDNLTSAVINYKIANGTVVTFNYSGNLAPGTTANVTLPSSTTYLGTHRLTAYSTLPNGVTDPSPELDTVELDFVVSNGINAPYTQNFESDVFPPDIKWVIDNQNSDCYEWQGASATSITGVLNNNTAQFPGFGNTSGGTDNLVTPIFILPCNATAADIKFDVAYRKRNTTVSNWDRLYVEISEDCGATWTATGYDKTGTTLEVLSTLSSYYTPVGASDWRTETIDLTSYITSSSKNVKFRFRAVAANGNNIYIDNFKFNVTSAPEVNVAQNGTEVFDEGGFDFGDVTVGTNSQKTFTVSNTGNGNLTLTLPVSITGSVFTLANDNLTTTIAAGTSKTFDVIFSPLTPTSYTETLSFVSSDCDEGTYNFYLIGRGVVNMPVANFSANSTSACTGADITFTNTSTYSSSYSWDFGPNAIPSTSTDVNPVVQFTTSGQHTVTLVATNPYGSDTEIKTNYVTAISSTGGQALPFTEGFSTATFPPTNWSRVNANSSATTWARSSTVGRTPTAGNSMFFNNFSFNDGDDDQMKMPGLDLSGLSSAELLFDVAYAPYNGTRFDGLEVLVSVDCGLTFTSVYSKSNTVLATAGATTTSFVPTAAQWRTETISLNAYLGNSNLIISFKNLSGNGQNLYVDNINVREGVVPTSDFSASSISVCTGSSVSFTDASTNSPTSWNWTFTGGTPGTSSAQNPTISYASPGTYAVTLTASNVNGTGTTMTKTSYITVAAPAVAATCNPTTGSTTYGITNVTLNTINNTTPLNNGAIIDYSCLIGTRLLSNTSYNISAVVGSAGSHWLRAYIDFNNDGDFLDTGEDIWAPANGTGTMTGSFTTPVSPVFNTLLRMRVIADRSGGGATTPGPCTALSRGQAEDYGIVISPPCTIPTITASSGDSRCGTGSLTISASASIGIINWYDAVTGGTLVGTGTSFTTPGLSVTTTYYAEAVNGACTSASRTPVVATVFECTKLIPAHCGINLDLIETILSYVPVAGATIYEIAVDGPGPYSQSLIRGNDRTNFRMSWFAGLSYNTTYLVKVRAYVGSTWTDYWDACSVTTPAIPLESKLNSLNCGRLLAAWDDVLEYRDIYDATDYEIWVQGPNSYSSTKIRSNNSTTFKMDWFTGLKYATTYTIKVRAYVDGSWTPYGSPCNVTTPPVPQTELIVGDCGHTLSSYDEILEYNPINRATNYDIWVQGPSSYSSSMFRNSDRTTFKLSWFTGLQINTTYTVRVRSYVDGIWGTFGPGCSVTTASSLSMKMNDDDSYKGSGQISGFEDFILETYPNPSDGNFTVRSSQECALKIVNELGQEVRQLTITKENNYQSKVEGLQRGVYFVTSSADSTILDVRKMVVHE